MIQIQPGSYIKASNQLDGTYFENAIIMVTSYNDEGAIGFVINKPHSRNLNDLVAFSNAAPFRLFEGGPVDQEHLFALHRRPDLIAESTEIVGLLSTGGDFRATVDLINTNIITSKDIKLFIGYCGWDKGELEAEIEEGSWRVTNEPDPFSGNY